MEAIIQAALAAHDAAPPVICVTPSIPILYFGDKTAYLKSPLRIVTVALNPSLAEFPPDAPFSRFPEAGAWIAAGRPPANCQDLQQAFNDYFKRDPYLRWFGSLEKVLTGFDASFYPNPDPSNEGHAKNTAIHTDLLSPVATSPTWSKIHDPGLKAALTKSGIPLWHTLIEELRPHLILISVAREHLASIVLKEQEAWKVFHCFPEKEIFPVMRSRAKWKDGEHVDLLWARAGQVPFQMFSHREKMDIGRALKGRLQSW